MGITRATNCLIHCKEIVRRIALYTFLKKTGARSRNWNYFKCELIVFHLMSRDFNLMQFLALFRTTSGWFKCFWLFVLFLNLCVLVLLISINVDYDQNRPSLLPTSLHGRTISFQSLLILYPPSLDWWLQCSQKYRMDYWDRGKRRRGKGLKVFMWGGLRFNPLRFNPFLFSLPF